MNFRFKSITTRNLRVNVQDSLETAQGATGQDHGLLDQGSLVQNHGDKEKKKKKRKIQRLV